MQRVIVTGGAGFIGSAVVRQLRATTTAQIMIVDKLTYAARRETIAADVADARVRLVQMDVCDRAGIRTLFDDFDPDTVFHLAAETHVDRSIGDASPFVETNIVGTFSMLDAADRHWRALAEPRRSGFRYLQISTDEVFGALGPDGVFTETSPYQPNSPYAASKAGADHLVRAYGHTYGLPVIITHTTNNFGRYQFPEKLIPHMIASALAGRPLPVYGDGRQVRDWIHVDDHAAALVQVAVRGKPGEVYNISARAERHNIDVVRTICSTLDRVAPDPAGPYARLITHVTDRLGHDRRYALDASKLERELGHRVPSDFERRLDETVRWYVDNRDWWQAGRVAT